VCEHVFVTVTRLRCTNARDLRGLQIELAAMVRRFDPDAVQLCDAPGLFAEADATSGGRQLSRP
jgi:hypothetical protein